MAKTILTGFAAWEAWFKRTYRLWQESDEKNMFYFFKKQFAEDTSFGFGATCGDIGGSPGSTFEPATKELLNKPFIAMRIMKSKAQSFKEISSEAFNMMSQSSGKNAGDGFSIFNGNGGGSKSALTVTFLENMPNRTINERYCMDTRIALSAERSLTKYLIFNPKYIDYPDGTFRTDKDGNPIK